MKSLWKYIEGEKLHNSAKALIIT